MARKRERERERERERASYAVPFKSSAGADFAPRDAKSAKLQEGKVDTRDERERGGLNIEEGETSGVAGPFYSTGQGQECAGAQLVARIRFVRKGERRRLRISINFDRASGGEWRRRRRRPHRSHSRESRAGTQHYLLSLSLSLFLSLFP